jgi:hypothetical protein
MRSSSWLVSPADDYFAAQQSIDRGDTHDRALAEEVNGIARCSERPALVCYVTITSRPNESEWLRGVNCGKFDAASEDDSTDGSRRTA